MRCKLQEISRVGGSSCEYGYAENSIGCRRVCFSTGSDVVHVLFGTVGQS